MWYNKTNLINDDSYEDTDYQEYEIMDYSNQELSLEEEEKAEEKRNFKVSQCAVEDDPFAFYNKKLDVERGEKSRERYARLAQIARTGNEEERREALAEACFYMKGCVRKFIGKFFWTYVVNDPGYANDLEQEAYFNIMKYLPFYDPKKGLPSTYFYRHIQSAMVTSTNQMKHSITPEDAALKRKIKRVQHQFEKLGRTPVIADYIIETGETMSKIRSVLRMMNMDINTHLEAIEDYDQFIAGNPNDNCMYDTPENIVIKNMVFEAVEKRMNELFSPDEVEIFNWYAINGESISTIIMKRGGTEPDDKIRRIIEKIRHAIQYDVNIRRLIMGSSQRNRTPDAAVVTLLPLEGENENMDLLENVVF